MSNNLAAYFATQRQNNNNSNDTITKNNHNNNTRGNDDDDMGPSVSMAIEAENDEDFHNLTFKLKRTQSMGLLDPTNPIAKYNKYNNNNNNNNNISTTSTDIHQRLPTSNIIDYDETHSDTSSDSSISSSSSSSSNISDDLVPDDEINAVGNNNNNNNNDRDSMNVNNYSKSSSVSPPAPDDDKLLPQDDNDAVREPQRHVDYLSHHWKESDISNSWKYIIGKKKKRDIDVVNTARLENASWRTWAKARNNLKTVSPEILNWSKDSDVTWLYGPIVPNDNFDSIDGDPNNKKKKIHNKDDYSYDDDDDDSDDYERGYGSDGDGSSMRLHSTNSPMVTQSIATDNHPHTSRQKITPKPILKRRTVTEIMEDNAQWRLNEARKHFNEVKKAQSIRDRENQPSIHDDYDLLAAKVNAQYFNYPSTSPNNNNNNISNHQQQQHQQPYSSNNNNNVTINPSFDNDRVDSSNDKIDIPSHTNNESDNLNISNKNNNTENGSSTTDSDSFTVSNTTVLNSNHRNKYTVSKDNSGSYMKDGTLSSILTTPSGPRSKNNNNDKSDSPNDNDTKTPNKDRHIHFNDRVEQCMIVKYPSDLSDDDIDSGFYSSDDDYNQKFSDYSDSESNSDSSGGENDDEHGLFINARFSRRTDPLAHSLITDNSSVGSNSANGKHNIHFRPSIKMLPATTLNYGSDEESDSNDYNKGYGNAISHNVNTQRGYDYIYDYNSVYTGDTSSFLPVDSCDIIDVPEGVDLQTAIADKNYQTYKMLPPSEAATNQSAVPLSPPNSDDQYYNSDDDQYSISSNTDDDQFIEDSQYHSSNSDSDYNSSDDEDYLQMGSKHANDDLGLKRTVSIGRSNNSLIGLTLDQSSTNSLKSTLSQTFLNSNTSAGSTKNNVITPATSSQSKNGMSLKRNLSKGFIFNSDSEDESDEAPSITNVKENIGNQTQEGDFNLSSLEVKPNPRRKLGPPQRSSSSLLLNTLNQSNKSDLGDSIKIPGNTASSPKISPSDVAIEGSFSPRNESLKSVISKENLMNYNKS